MSDIHEQMKLAWAIYLQETEKFDGKGIKTSAVRARQALTDLKDLIVERRKEIQDKKTEL